MYKTAEPTLYTNAHGNAAVASLVQNTTDIGLVKSTGFLQATHTKNPSSRDGTAAAAQDIKLRPGSV